MVAVSDAVTEARLTPPALLGDFDRAGFVVEVLDRLAFLQVWSRHEAVFAAAQIDFPAIHFVRAGPACAVGDLARL